jgi:hypothetical protein
MVDYLELVTQDEETKETLKLINSKADRIDKLVLNMFHATLEELEQLEVDPQEMSSREIGNIIKECDALKRVTESDIKDCMVYQFSEFLWKFEIWAEIRQVFVPEL